MYAECDGFRKTDGNTQKWNWTLTPVWRRVVSGIGGATCIITVKKRMKRLLYDLHNEVLEAAEIRINTECSLTICEGISFLTS